MSSVRMCDRCGTIFSERADGWSTFSGTTRKRDPETGKFDTVSDTLDSCPECTEMLTSPPVARPVAQLGTRPQYERPGVTGGQAAAAG
jgi:hypothetical protein